VLTVSNVKTFADKGYQRIRTPFKRHRHRPRLSRALPGSLVLTPTDWQDTRFNRFDLP
jgi:hypothetical protein